MCDAGGNHCGIALCGRVDVGPLEYRGCGHADGHVHVLGDLADVNRVVVRHDRVDDDNDVQLDTDIFGDGDRFVVAADVVLVTASLSLGCTCSVRLICIRQNILGVRRIDA